MIDTPFLIARVAYYVMVGWCGTIPRPKFPLPPSPPDPTPWWRSLLFGSIGGITGGYLVGMLGYTDLVGASFGALAGGRIVSELGESLLSKPRLK